MEAVAADTAGTAGSISLATQRALPLPRHETTRTSRLLSFTCYCAVAQPCLGGWTPAWVPSGSVEGSDVIKVFPSCRDCISTAGAGLHASFHEAAFCVENHSIARTADLSTQDIKVLVLCP